MKRTALPLTRLWWCLCGLACANALAREAAPVATDPVLEARVMAIAAELRCLVCQNQTIADSHSGLAEDLRHQVREQVRAGASDEQVVQFMTDRYGDFVRYRPPWKASTLLLWIGPAAFLVLGLGVLVLVLRRRAKLAPEQFEPDVDELAAPERTAQPVAGDPAR